ncbi:macrophage mannose receptor 1-like isoform X2 [Betta splendens]|nr:macrophage mannose receptor 1-like isoform X2 [Betta splendens]
MNYKLLVAFVCFGFGHLSCSHAYFFEYQFINQSLNWSQAQQYCRVHYTDLATIESMEDVNRLIRPNASTSLAWIGLNDDPLCWQVALGTDVNSWRWSATGKPSATGYRKWQYNQPNNSHGNQFYATMNVDGTWNDQSSDNNASFVCYTMNYSTGQSTYTVINDTKMWNNALTYCRTYHTDLAMIENSQQNSIISSLKAGQSVWFGLYRVAWKWSDRSSSSFRNWQTGFPNNADTVSFCAAETPDHFWKDQNCSNTYPFWCHRALTLSMTTVRMKIQTDADLSDPATTDQLLQQIGLLLQNALAGTIKMGWKIQPQKLEEPSTGRVCGSYVCN